VIFGNVPHTVTISAIAEDKQFVFRSDDTADNSFHAISAASLQEYGSVFVGGYGGKGYKRFTDFFYNVYVIVGVPCTPIGHHGFFYGF